MTKRGAGRALPADPDPGAEAQLLDAAERCFAAAGYAGARMRDVAKLARVSLATLYQRYPNKEALYAAVHARRLEALMPRVRAATAAAGSPLERLLAGLRTTVAFHTEHADYLAVHLREVAAWWAPSELRSDAQLGAWNRGQRDMVAAFEQGMADGVFVIEDPVFLTRATHAITQVALARWVEGGMTMAPTELGLRVCRQIIRAFCVPERTAELLARHGGGP
ncbi:MAG: TetR/AcrR family transcriptional regulator [Deltaproteobacteria bacterium]|nr:TetR/AcrR family transcriptional regulator [Deltaproteobacteria bacterium]MCB9787089.1 TetR/AcrR family transcriptional regulator [Deltaproteobacteria bacterium]